MFCSAEILEVMMNKNNGTLDISDTWITQPPDDLIVRGDLILNRYIKEFLLRAILICVIRQLICSQCRG